MTTDRPLDHNMGLYQLQGVGFVLIGNFRSYQGTYATYRFFALFWLPLFPIDCVRVQVVGYTPTETDSEDVLIEHGIGLHYNEPDEDYDIYSYEKWNFLEILSIYLGRYGYTISIVSVIWGIIKFVF